MWVCVSLYVQAPAVLQGVHVTLRSMTTDFQPLASEEDDTEGGT